MNNTANEILQFVKENDVKFIRLNFCDIFGLQKNISIMADELQCAFESGVSFDAHAIHGFRDVTKSDLLLFPDPNTLSILPWRPGPGRVIRFYCDIKNPEGSMFVHNSRFILKQTVERAERMGYACKIGTECEFYLFKTDEDGRPTGVTLDSGGYLDIAPLDRGEDIRREICLTLEEMGIKPETSYHEQGPGQNEIDFRFNGAVESADNFQSFKSAVKAIASRNGLFASFMPKPILNAPGSGMHISLSLSHNRQEIVKKADEGRSIIAESFIAGLLARMPEITLFLNPIANSYERFGKFEAPQYVSWSHQNCSQLIRLPAMTDENAGMKLRSPDPSSNPYLAFSLIIAAGLDGMENNMILPPAVDTDLYTADQSVTKKLARLPDSLNTAIAVAENSAFVKSVLGEELVLKYIAIKKKEAADFAAVKDKTEFYKERYFYFI
jgi:glutamine synthetase